MAAEYFEAAESYYVLAQALAPSEIRWPYYLGHVYMTRGESAKSVASFERALRLRPTDVATLHAIVRELLTEEAAIDPQLPRLALDLVFSIMNGLALGRAIPGYDPVDARELLEVFKTMVRAALPPDPQGGTR